MLLVAAVGDQVSACFLARCRLPSFCLTARIVLHGAMRTGVLRLMEGERGDAWSLLPFPGRTAVREGVVLKPGPPASASGCLGWVGV